jgi:hypothetical protein
VQESSNGYVYAQYEYLELFCPHWVAWVDKDYQFGWPLIYNRKWGIQYLYQPYFVAQLGAMSRLGTTDFQTGLIALWQRLPKKYLYVDIDLPEDHQSLSQIARGFYRQTMTISLEQGIVGVQRGYHRLARRMIQRSQEARVHIEIGTDIENDLIFYQAAIGAQMRTHPEGYGRLRKVLIHAQAVQQLLHLRATVDGQLVGIYFLLYSDRYMHSVAGCASPLGKELGAFYALTDAALSFGSTRSRSFRFEGSDHPGIASFNRQFGAATVPYWHIKGWRF